MIRICAGTAGHWPRSGLNTAAVLLLAVIASACDGDDDKRRDGILFDPAGADEIAHLALLDGSDLPTGGWLAGGDDEFGGEEDRPSTPACRAVTGSLYTTWVEDQPNRLGRALRFFGRDDGFAGIVVQVHIFSDVRTPETALIERRKLIESDDYDTCLAETTENQQSSPDGRPQPPSESRKTEPLAKAPLGGIATAHHARLTIDGKQVDLRMELYEWRYGNAGVTAQLIGGEHVITEELVKAALNTVQDKLEARAAD